MTAERRAVTILMADDDLEDREFAREALETSRLANDFRTVEDGVELLRYLRREGRWAEPGAAPRPGLILLDLNMPKMSGLEALKELRRDSAIPSIPVVVLTTSSADRDITESYELGANSYIQKPVTFDGLVEALRAVGQYWFEIVELPSEEGGGRRQEEGG